MNDTSSSIKKIALLLSLVGLLLGNGYAQPRTIPASYGAGSQVNYIRVWDAAVPLTDQVTLVASPVRNVRQKTQYFDGLGRLLQTVSKQGSLPTGGSAVDMTATVEYDALGREQFRYLPSPANNTGGNTSITDGRFKANPFAQQAVFFNAASSTSPLYNQAETYFYSQSAFEPSPLNRVQEAAGPGDSWTGTMTQPLEANRRSVKTKYFNNTATDAVRTWAVTNAAVPNFGTYATAGTYAAGTLVKSITIDEQGKQVVEFKDKEDRIILKKQQLSASDNGTTGSGHTGWLCTYYIYDNAGNLRCVIQPRGVELLAAATWAAATLTALLPEQCFRYEYDSRKRIIIKKNPGANEVYMVYDAKDRLVMTQDANLRLPANNKWLVTLYDKLNRPVQTGLLLNTWNNKTFAQHLTDAATGPDKNNYPFAVTALPAATYWTYLTKTGYDDYTALPAASTLTATIDNTYTGSTYGFFTAYNTAPDFAQPLPAPASLLTRGLVTWTETKILETSSYIYTVNLYDDKARPIQVKTKNSTTGTDILTTQYNWSGQPLVTVLKQEKAASAAQTTVIITKMKYDDLGRLAQTDKKISNTNVNANALPAAFTTISKHDYDALGQLKNKNLGNKPGSPAGTPLAKANFEYNIRGWLLSLNKTYMNAANADQYFAMELGYDKNASAGTFTPQQNGSIGGMLWKAEGDQQRRKYDFTYDAANRLTAASFTQYVSGTGTSAVFNTTAGIDYSVSALNYDANGNILAMAQKGWKITGSNFVDNLRYTYLPNSNKLKNVTDFNNDPQTRLGDFKTNTTHPQNTAKAALTTASTQASFDAITDYNYDVNGNLALDNNKALSAITYNHLNLPLSITVAGKGTITFTWDANGNKVKKVTQETGAAVTYNGTNYTGITITTTTTYLDGAVYETKVYSNATLNTDLGYTEQLQFITHEEGKIRFAKATVSTCPAQSNRLLYDYFIKDHLGNIRTVLTEQKEDICYIPATVEDATYTTEQKFYDITDARRILRTTVGAPQTSFQSKLYQTHGGLTGQKTGLGITLKVMAGDKVKIFAESFYTMPAGGNAGGPLNMALADLLTTFAGSGPVNAIKGTVTATDVQNLGSNNTQLTSFITRTPPAFTAKAYLNWILFDDQLKYIASGAEPVATSTAAGGGAYKQQLQFTNAPVTITTSGFFYVFASNESNTAVYFDNLVLTHTPGPIMEENQYYPYGLTMGGISSRAAGKLENKNLFLSEELQSKEFNDGSGLEMYDLGARMYDHQIGRFGGIDALAEKFNSWSPYSYSYDNPLRFADPTGMAAFDWVRTEDGEMLYDSRVIDQKTAEEYYGKKATYRPNGYTYTASSGEAIELGDLGFFKSNGVVKPSADHAEDGINQLKNDLSSVQASLLGVMAVRGAQATDVAIPDPTDVLPWKWVAHAAIFAGTAYLISKYQDEIADLVERINGPQGVQYALKATTTGNYPIMSFGSSTPTGTMPLNAGDVWKYGETINPATRYDQTFLTGVGVQQENQFYGNQIQIKVAEKTRIYSYFVTHGHLPPGNKIFR